MTSIDIYSASIPVVQSKTEIYINKAKLVHGDLYDYSLVEYINAHVKIKIICDIHGTFEQQPRHHLNGNGCRDCGNIAKATSNEIFIENAILIHGELYSYNLVGYVNNRTKVKIICKIHGIFEQRPDNHLGGKGCIECHGIPLSNTEDFIEKTKVIHGDFYNYEFTNYINSRTKVKIICKIHGIFEQSPNSHLKGEGCPKCSKRISKISTNWLKALNVEDMIFEYKLPENKRKAVDGYSPSTNTVYQFHGDYWHGNQSKYKSTDINPTNKISYGELYEKTIESDLWILSLGYNLITIWESTFNQTCTS